MLDVSIHREAGSIRPGAGQMESATQALSAEPAVDLKRLSMHPQPHTLCAEPHTLTVAAWHTFGL